MCSHVNDFNARNKYLIARLLNKVIGINNFESFFQILSPTHDNELVSKSLLHL